MPQLIILEAIGTEDHRIQLFLKVIENSVFVTDDLDEAMLQRDQVSDIPVHAIADAGVDNAVPAVDVLAKLY